MKVVDGQPNHASAMWKLAEESYFYGSPWRLPDFLESLSNPDHYIYCLVESGKLQGFIQWQTVLDEGEILNIVVAKNAKRKGLGTLLLKKSIEKLSEKEISRFFLEVRKDNFPGIALYNKFGFQKIGTRKQYYQHPIADGLVFCLEKGE